MEFAVAQTSLAHTYGNITCFIADYIKNLFPKNYFKTVHISTSIAHKQFSIFQNSNKEFLKKSKPMLIIRPRIEVDDSSVFLYDTYLTTNAHNIYMDRLFTNLQPFIEDKENNVFVKFLLNRLKMQFDISIITETYMDALNQSHFLKNRLPINYYHSLPTSLESYVPRELFKLLGDIADVPMYADNNSVAPFMEYVNSHSLYPVSYKMKNSTGNDEFFRYYPANVEIGYSGLSVDEGNKKGHIVDSCAVQLSLTAEFNASGLYYIFTKDTVTIDAFKTDIATSDKIIPIFTYDQLYVSKYGTGWNVFCAPIYSVDNDIEDVTDISSLFNSSILYVIKYHLNNNIPLDLFIKTEVMKNSTPLNDDDFVVDFEKLTLTTKSCNTRAVYRFIVHVHTQYINSLLNEVYDLSKER